MCIISIHTSCKSTWNAQQHWFGNEFENIIVLRRQFSLENARNMMWNFFVDFSQKQKIPFRLTIGKLKSKSEDSVSLKRFTFSYKQQLKNKFKYIIMYFNHRTFEHWALWMHSQHLGSVPLKFSVSHMHFDLIRNETINYWKLLSFKKKNPFCLLLRNHAMCQSNDVTACVARVYLTYYILIGLPFEMKIFWKFWLNSHSHLIQMEIILFQKEFGLRPLFAYSGHSQIWIWPILFGYILHNRLKVLHLTQSFEKTIRFNAFLFVPDKRIE